MNELALVVTKVPAIGTEEIHTLHGRVTIDTYPQTEQSKTFWLTRKQLQLSRKQAADKLGINMIELCKLENGSGECNWTIAMQRLTAP